MSETTKNTSRLEAVVHGRVQMVMYRDFSVRNARALGLRGEVKNLADGAVVVIAEGKKEILETFLGYLHQGPFLAKVEHIDVQWMEPSGVYSGFHITYG